MPLKRAIKPTRKKTTGQPKKKKTLRAPLKKRIVRTRRAAAPAGRRPAAVRSKLAKLPGQKLVGKITHYYPQIQVAVVKLTAPLNTNDNIRIKGHSTDFIQPVTSMQLDHVTITIAKKGQEIGLQVTSRVREKDLVFRVEK